MGSFFRAVFVEELFGVAVVGDNEKDALSLANFGGEASELEVDGLHRNNGCFHVCGVADHVATGEIQADKMIIVEIFDNFIGNFGGFHPRASIEWNGVGRDFDEIFLIGFLVAVAVEIISNMTEFDGLGNCELADAVFAEDFV